MCCSAFFFNWIFAAMFFICLQCVKCISSAHVFDWRKTCSIQYYFVSFSITFLLISFKRNKYIYECLNVHIRTNFSYKFQDLISDTLYFLNAPVQFDFNINKLELYKRNMRTHSVQATPWKLVFDFIVMVE